MRAIIVVHNLVFAVRISLIFATKKIILSWILMDHLILGLPAILISQPQYKLLIISKHETFQRVLM